MFTTESRLGGVRDELGGRGGPEAEGQGAETRCVRAAGRGGCKDQVCEGSGVGQVQRPGVQGQQGREGRPRLCL